MTFVSYTPLDALGTITGLNLLEKIANNFWQGTFLGEGILAIFVFLSLAKIAVDGIMEHKYESALFEFAKLAIVILLFTVNTTATIFDMDIINFGYTREAAKMGSTTTGNISNGIFGANNSNPTSAQVYVDNVPLMADIYAIPDNLAYELSNIMLNPKKTITIDLASIVLDPKSILTYAYNSMYDAATNKAGLDADFALCYDKKDYKVFSNYVKASGGSKSNNNFIVTPFESMPIYTGKSSDINTVCSKFNEGWYNAIKNIEQQMEQEGGVSSKTFNAVNNMASLIKNGNLQSSKKYKEEFLGKPLKELKENAKAYNEIIHSKASTGCLATSQSNSTIGNVKNNASCIPNGATSLMDEQVAPAFMPRIFFEDLMMHMQEYAIAIMFILLPFVVILGLLPIFGNNFKLIIKYSASFFLIKLWFPILWLVYISMVDVSALLASTVNIKHEINNGIEYAITTFTGQPAFAQQGQGQTSNPNSSTQNALDALIVAAEAEKYSQFNKIILEAMYTIIPTVLGSSATYLVGKGMVDTGVAAAAEGMMLSKYTLGKLGSLLGGAGSLLGKFGKRNPPNEDEDEDEEEDDDGSFFDDMINGARNALGKARDVAGDAFGKARNVVGDVLDKVGDAAGDAFSKARNVASDALGKVGDVAGDALDDVGSGVAGGVGTIFAFSQPTAGKILDEPQKGVNQPLLPFETIDNGSSNPQEPNDQQE